MTMFIVRLIILSASLLFSNFCFAQDKVWSYDVLDYHINLNICNLSLKKISGFSQMKIKSTYNLPLDSIYLFLKALKVDSVFYNDKKVGFNQKGELISCATFNFKPSDTIHLKLFYGGNPVLDPYWGGFYFSSADGGYAFNMGVGFEDIPHNYGRVWFPCNDNFNDKATYTYIITTDADKMAVCGGLLTNTKLNADNTVTYTWELKQEIPTYLASVAVGKYVLIHNKYKGKEKEIDIVLAALASDTTKLKSSFANLNNCISVFEDKFGSYQFDRVGFVVVPFNSGAMEHATNIAYPKYAVNGNLVYENLMVHEFSHHWWGNLVTCSSAEDMWLNEGWARWSEWLFDEVHYGKAEYLNELKENHRNVLQYAHIRDLRVLPLSPMPIDVTYGTHTYDKGADVVHCLRTYMGDSLFFLSIQQFLNEKKFKNCSSSEFRDYLKNYSGLNLDNFFDNWVFEKGFPHFTVELNNKNKNAEIQVIQNLRFTNKLYKEVPLILSFFDKNFNRHDIKIVVSDTQKTYQVALPFVPEIVISNIDYGIAEAKTFDSKTINKTGDYNFTDALFYVSVNGLKDSALVFVEHHWLSPQNINPSLDGIRLSDYRYWSVKGIFPALFNADARINYNGTEGTMTGSDYLDHTLKIVNEDSLVLLYRENYFSSWKIFESYKIITGSKTDKRGIIEIYNLKPGDYCLGIKDYKSNVIKSGYQDRIKIYPNPANQSFMVSFNAYFQAKTVRLFDISGMQLHYFDAEGKVLLEIPVKDLKPGYYIISVENENEQFTKKILIGS